MTKRLPIGLCSLAVLISLGYLAMPAIIRTADSNAADPKYEELRAAVVEIATRVDIPTEGVQRNQRGGNVVETSKDVAQLDVSQIADPDELFNQLEQSIEQLGYKRTEGVLSNGPLTGSWNKKDVRINVFLGGASGRGVQSVKISLEAEPS